MIALKIMISLTASASIQFNEYGKDGVGLVSQCLV